MDGPHGCAGLPHRHEGAAADASNATEVPRLIDDIVKAGGRGVANAHGFHAYTKEEAELWEETFREFSYEIRRLALKYPADVVKRRLEEREKGDGQLGNDTSP